MDIMEQSDGGNKVTYTLRYRTDLTPKRLQFKRSKNWVADTIIEYNIDLSTSTWYHIAGTYDGTNLRMYLATSSTHLLVAGPTSDSGNGTSQGSNHFSVGIGDDSQGNGFTPNNGRYFDGQVDDARVYSAALSTSTMDADFQKELQGNETSLVAYYKFNNSYVDTTANGYNLTAVNSPTFATTVPFGDGGGSGGGGQGVTTTYYYTYGTTTVPSRQFIGQFFDSTTNLSYLNARYYDPGRGQFLSQDSVFWEVGLTQDGKSAMLNPQLMNSYSYARDNPIANKDPSGRLDTGKLSLNLVALAGQLTQLLVLLGGSNVAGRSPVARPISSSFLNRSLSINPGALTITPTNQDGYGNVIDAIKKDQDFKQYVNEKLANVKNGKVDVPADKNGFRFNKGDLKSSLLDVRAGLSGVQSKDGSWNLNVNIKDTWQFRFDRTGYRNDGVLTTLNNAAYVSQQSGVISKYDININFNLNNYKP